MNPGFAPNGFPAPVLSAAALFHCGPWLPGVRGRPVNWGNSNGLSGLTQVGMSKDACDETAEQGDYGDGSISVEESHVHQSYCMTR